MPQLFALPMVAVAVEAYEPLTIGVVLRHFAHWYVGIIGILLLIIHILTLLMTPAEHIQKNPLTVIVVILSTSYFAIQTVWFIHGGQ